MGAEARCVECGGPIGPEALVVGLYVDATEDLGFLDVLGEFCAECAGRFTQRTRKDAGPCDPGISVNPQAAREAALRAAKRLRKLARELETAEYEAG